MQLDRLRSEIAAGGPTVRLAEEDAVLAGYVVFATSRDPDAVPGEVRTFFVHPRFWRGGVGTQPRCGLGPTFSKCVS